MPDVGLLLRCIFWLAEKLASAFYNFHMVLNLISQFVVSRCILPSQQEVSRGPPKPWTLTDKQGHADIILRRSHGQEDIAVTCVYQPDTYGENHADDEPEGSDQDERDDESASCVNMTITVNKGADNPTLEISATSYGNEISIDHVYFWEDKDSRDALYDGPNFM